MMRMPLRELESALSRSSSSISSSGLSSISRSLIQRNAKPVKPIINGNSTGRLTVGTSRFGKAREVEGLGGLGIIAQEKTSESFFHRFRKNKRYLTVTDITRWEWCSTQAKFKLSCGKSLEATKAMKEGKARHEKLEEFCRRGNEPIRKNDSRNVKCHFDGNYRVADNFLDFIDKTNQLLLEGLVREMPIVFIVEGIWTFGKIDEIRLPLKRLDQPPIFVDTKTRSEDNAPYPPPEPQKRNGRLQLMCYKYLWDNSVADNFPMDQFFKDLELNPDYILPKKLQERASNLGSPVKTLRELVMFYRNTCSTLHPASDDLLLRYLCQTNGKLLDVHKFKYDSDWLKSQVKGCVEFWLREREPNYVSEEERWKCWDCTFAKKCPSNTKPLMLL